MLVGIGKGFEVWSAAVVNGKSAGRGSNGKTTAYGVKKLRELILELAVRGKLVPQDPDDEPARVLLEKIAEEKAGLVNSGKVKKQESLLVLNKDEALFELPNGWRWTKLGNLSADVHYGYTASANPQVKDVRLLRITDIQDDSVDWDSVPGCEIDNNKVGAYQLQDGDILIARTGGTIGKSYLVSEIQVCSVFASYLIRVRYIKGVYSPFIKTFLGSQSYWEQLYANSMGTGQPNVNGNALKNLRVPLPPLAEQHRIVAKVDELMALCDALEAEQRDSIAAHERLVECLLGTLTAAENAHAFTDAWRRIADHFDTLFTTEHSIDQLKQCILQLAVMGKLVPQDPADEPASLLLERIAEERARLVETGVAKKQKATPKIPESDEPFELPKGWAFVRLADLCILITKGSSPKWQGVSYTENHNDVLFVTSENVGSYLLKLESRKYVEKKFNEIEPRSILQRGDFLMNIVGASIGRTAMYTIDNTANINQAVCLIRIPLQFSDPGFLLHFFNSECCVSYMFDKQVDNARANLSMSNIARFVVPVPPLAEQHRIVAKVDELMALCDALKARLSEAQTTQAHLADVVVAQAIA